MTEKSSYLTVLNYLLKFLNYYILVFENIIIGFFKPKNHLKQIPSINITPFIASGSIIILGTYLIFYPFFLFSNY